MIDDTPITNTSQIKFGAAYYCPTSPKVIYMGVYNQIKEMKTFVILKAEHVGAIGLLFYIDTKEFTENGELDRPFYELKGVEFTLTDKGY